MLSNKFKGKISFSESSKLYKIIKIYKEPIEPTIYFPSAQYGVNEDYISFINKIQKASKINNFQHWITSDSVAFIFEGCASSAQIIPGSNIMASLEKTNFYQWDTTSNCLVENTVKYNNDVIKNQDLPVLRACNTARFFSDSLKATIFDIEKRIFPVAREIKQYGGDDPKERFVNFYIIAKPQEAKYRN